MRNYAAYILLICAIGAAVFSFWGDQSYSSYVNLQKSLELHREKNTELRQQVDGLKREIYGLRKDDRVLEKAARNQLGMARPDELTFIFEKSAQDLASGQ